MRWIVAVAVAALAVCSTAYGEAGVLIVQVEDAHGAPAEGVVVTVKGGGGTTGPPTTVDGKTRIPLAAGVQPGDVLELTIVPRRNDPHPWQFSSPRAGRVIVPRFEVAREALSYVTLVVLRQGKRENLTDPEIVAMFFREANKAATVAAATSKPEPGAAPDPAAVAAEAAARRRGLEDSARTLGVTPEALAAAFRIELPKGDAAAQGLAALNEGDFDRASRLLVASVAEQQAALQSANDKLADTAFYAAFAFLSRNEYGKAGEMLDIANRVRPNDPYLLMLLSAVRMADARLDEAFEPAVLALNAMLASPPDTCEVVVNGALLIARIALLKGKLNDAREVLEMLSGTDCGREVPGGIEHLLGVVRSLVAPDRGTTLSELEAALPDLERRNGANSLDVLMHRARIEFARAASGDPARAAPALEAIALRLARVAGPDSPVVTNSLRDLAQVYLLAGKYDQAYEAAVRAHSVMQCADPALLERFGVDSALGLALFMRRDYAGARKIQEANYAATVRSRDSLPHWSASLALSQTICAQSVGEDCRTLLEEVVDVAGKLDYPPIVRLRSEVELARAVAITGDVVRGREIGERALTAVRAISGDRHDDTLLAMEAVMVVAALQGDLARAVTLAIAATGLAEGLYGLDHPIRQEVLTHAAAVYAGSGLDGQSVLAATSAAAAASPQAHQTLRESGDRLRAGGQHGAAAAFFELLCERERTSLGERHPQTIADEWAYLELLDAQRDVMRGSVQAKRLEWLAAADASTMAPSLRPLATRIRDRMRGQSPAN